MASSRTKTPSTKSNFALLVQEWLRSETFEEEKRMVYILQAYTPGLASYGLDNEESRSIDMFFEKELPDSLKMAQKCKQEGKLENTDALEAAMAQKLGLMIRRINRMLTDKERFGTPQQMGTIAERRLNRVEDRLTRIERLAPLLQAFGEVSKEGKKIDVFLTEELPDCRAEIQKMKAAGEEESAKLLEDAMAEKLVATMTHIQENDKQLKRLKGL